MIYVLLFLLNFLFSFYLTNDFCKLITSSAAYIMLNFNFACINKKIIFSFTKYFLVYGNRTKTEMSL